MSEILTREYLVFPVQPLIIRNKGEQIITNVTREKIASLTNHIFLAKLQDYEPVDFWSKSR